MNRLVSVFALLIVAFAATADARLAVTNLHMGKPAVAEDGPTSNWDNTAASDLSSWGASNAPLAWRFTATQTGTIASVRHDRTAGTSGFHFELWSQSGDVPGSQIGSDSNDSTSTGDQTTTFPTPPSVTKDTVYWMVFIRTGGSGSASSSMVQTGATAYTTRYSGADFNNPPGLTSGDDLTDEIQFEINYN